MIMNWILNNLIYNSRCWEFMLALLKTRLGAFFPSLSLKFSSKNFLLLRRFFIKFSSADSEVSNFPYKNESISPLDFFPANNPVKSFLSERKIAGCYLI